MEAMTETLASLIAAAALVGAPMPAVTVPRAAPGPRAPVETVVASVPLAALAAGQSGAFVSRPLGGAALEASAAFDSDGNFWVKLRQGGWRASYSDSALKAGATADLPSGRASLKRDGDVLRAVLPSGEAAEWTGQELANALHAAAVKVPLAFVTYAALYEDGAAAPAALCLMRRDAAGNYFVTYRTPAEMKTETQWVMATGGLVYGMALRGTELVFVSKPLPPTKAR
jgi:hypothetical protein